MPPIALPFRWHADIRNPDPALTPILKLGAGHRQRTRASQIAHPTVHVICDEAIDVPRRGTRGLQRAAGHLMCGGDHGVFGLSGGTTRAVTCTDCLRQVARVQRSVALAA